MSDLPQGWEWATLNEIGNWYGGGTPSKHDSKFWQGGTIPWLSPKDMSAGTIARTLDHITDEALASSATRLVPANSIAIVVRSGVLERRLPVALVPFPTTLNQDMRAVVPHSGIGALWIAHYLRSVESQLLETCRKHGTTVASIDSKRLMTTRIPVAPAPEQRRIVVALEDHLSRLDAGQRSISSAAAKMRNFRTARLDDLVLKGGVHSTRTWGDTSYSELEGRAVKKLDYSSLPPLPSGWKWRVASEICESIACGGTPKSDLMHANSGEIPFLKVYNLTRAGTVDFNVRPTFIDRYTHEGLLRRSRVRPGDVLTNIVGPPLGKTAVVPSTWPQWNINQAIVAFRAGPEIAPAWLAATLQSPFILGLLKRTARATAGQFNISLSTCRELPIPVPPKYLQLELAGRTQVQLDQAERSSMALSLITSRGEHLQESLLAEAFAGRLVLQDPNDEPASVLLERIKAERATQPKVKRGRRSRKAETGQESLL